MRSTGKLKTRLARGVALAALAVAVAGPAALSPSTALAAEPFLGQLSYFAFNFAPKGWTTCDGQVMAIAQNQALFSLLGTTYGGNGVNTFQLPDMRGRAPIHSDGSPYTLGQTGGTENTTLLTSNLPPHVHSVGGTVPVGGTITASLNASPTNGNTHDAAGNSLAPGGARVRNFQTGAPNVAMSAGSVAVDTSGVSVQGPAGTGNAGGSQPFNHMPPYLVLNCSIALVGIFPSRN